MSVRRRVSVDKGGPRTNLLASRYSCNRNAETSQIPFPGPLCWGRLFTVCEREKMQHILNTGNQKYLHNVDSKLHKYGCTLECRSVYMSLYNIYCGRTTVRTFMSHDAATPVLFAYSLVSMLYSIQRLIVLYNITSNVSSWPIMLPISLYV